MAGDNLHLSKHSRISAIQNPLSYIAFFEWQRKRMCWLTTQLPVTNQGANHLSHCPLPQSPHQKLESGAGQGVQPAHCTVDAAILTSISTARSNSYS